MLEQLATDIAANRPAVPNRGYPAWLRERVIAAATEATAAGSSLHGTARKLGLSPNTLRRWTAGERQPASTFRPVRVASAPARRRFRLRAPSGFEVDDLELDDVVALLRELA